MDKKHKSKQELAKELNMSARTLHRRIKELNIARSGRLLSPRECEDLARRLEAPQGGWQQPGNDASGEG